jgi:hypothetical protein
MSGCLVAVEPPKKFGPLRIEIRGDCMNDLDRIQKSTRAQLAVDIMTKKMSLTNDRLRMLHGTSITLSSSGDSYQRNVTQSTLS